MNDPYLDEAQAEFVAVEYFRELGYAYVHGPAITRDGLPGRQAGEKPEWAD